MLTRGPEVADDAQEAAEALSWKGTRLEVYGLQHGHTLEQLKAMASVSGKRMLIDGGATNALRGPMFEGEELKYERVTVGLAVGQAQLSQTPAGILIADKKSTR